MEQSRTAMPRRSSLLIALGAGSLALATFGPAEAQSPPGAPASGAPTASSAPAAPGSTTAQGAPAAPGSTTASSAPAAPDATTAQGAPAASNGATPDAADALFAQGNEAFDRGALDEAYGLYQKAWGLKRTYDIAGNLGQVELKLGRFRDAAEHLDFTLRLFPPTGKAAPREAIRRAFEAARKEVAALSIRVSAQGAAVAIDGKAIGLSPFEVPVFVEPGKRTLEASLEAHLATRIVIEVEKGESRDVALSLVPKNQPPPPPRNIPLMLTGFGLGLAAAGTGVGLMIASSSKGSQADGLLQQLVAADPDGACPCGSDADRKKLKGMRQDHDLFFNAATGMFVAAGVLALGTTLYALTPSFQRPSTKPATGGGRGPDAARNAAPKVELRVLPAVSTQGAGALVIGTF